MIVTPGYAYVTECCPLAAQGLGACPDGPRNAVESAIESAAWIALPPGSRATRAPQTETRCMNRRLLGIIILVCLVMAGVLQMLTPLWLGPSLAAYEVVAQPLVQTVVATGRMTAVSRAQVGSLVTGVVLERRVREGDRVQAGDVLAVLRADDLAAAVREAEAALAELQASARPQAYAAVREAQAALAQAQREARRRRELFAQRAIAREDMERALQAEATARAAAEQAQLAAQSLESGQPNEAAARARLASARAQLEKTTIRAEVAGTVLTRNVEPGDLVQPNRILFEIARDDDMEVLVPVDEQNLATLALGQRALCIADAYPTQPFAATVSFIAPSVDPQRGTVDVRLNLDTVPDFVRHDMTLSVNIETGRRDRTIAVPNDALSMRDGNQAELWLVVEGRSERRRVELGLRGLTSTEVTAGLNPGDIILANAQAHIQPGDRVRPLLAPQPASLSTDTRKELPFRLD